MSAPKAYINLNNLRDNINYLKSISEKAQLYPVIKADGYGHGSIRIAKELEKIDVSCVCVATYCEIYDLISNKVNIDILHLGKVFYEKF